MDARDFEKLREIFEKRWIDVRVTYWPQPRGLSKRTGKRLPKARSLSQRAINRLEKRLEKKYGNLIDLENVSKNKSNKA